MTKMVRTFHFSFPLNVAAADVWALLHDRFCDVSDYANEVRTSRCVSDGSEPGDQVRRVCNFNESGTKFLQEDLVDVDERDLRMTSKIVGVGKLPIEPELSRTTFAVRPQSANQCIVDVEACFRTKPAFLSLFMKGASKTQMANLFAGAEHFLRTGEKVTPENFKRIKAARA